jgi:hypothetical protein
MYDDQPMGGPGKQDMGADQKREQQDDQETAVLPKGFFQGKDLSPGTECKVKIERVMDNEVMVSYVPHDGDGEEDAAPAPSAPMDNEPASAMYG